MSSRLDALCVLAHDPERLAGFWGAVLTRDVEAATDTFLLPGSEPVVPLRFRRGDVSKDGANSVHLHLTSSSLTEQQQTVQRCLDLGAAQLDVGQLPDEGHVVLADPEGNEYCVIEPGNSFLAGCGFLGELACDGTAEVGRFWSAALGWPLVWDEDEETAVQSPLGGTKVAWGGPPLTATTRRMRFELLADGDRDAEVERLVSLGATVVVGASVDAPYVVLHDPDGGEFHLL
jgi:hypothetical protein